MDSRTLEALKGSIKKWEDTVAGTGVDNGALNCPLCKVFLKPNSNDILRKDRCSGCPVAEATSQPYCMGTPCYDYTDSAPNYQIMHAQAELDFLRSLLPVVDAPPVLCA